MANADSASGGGFQTGLCADVLGALELGVALLDAKANVLYANRSLQERFLEGEQPPAGRPLLDAFPSLSADFDWDRAVGQAVERGRTLRLARQSLLDRGHFDLTLAPMRETSGEVHSALLTVEDVSDAVRLEARLLSQARTHALANLGESVAHEIRNPLNSIHMNVQLLREGMRTEELDRESLHRTAEIVQSEIKRQSELLADRPHRR